MNELKSIYIGRKEQIELIQDILRSMISNVESKRKNESLSPYKELYFFYGEAGIGKSSLLKMIQNDYEKKSKEYLTDSKVHFISWNFEWSYTIVEVLISLRKILTEKLKYNFYEFDYIIYQYYSHMGEEYGLPKLPTLTDKLEENSITRIINTVSDFIPNASIIKSFGDIFSNAATYLKNKKLDETYKNVSMWTNEQYEEEAIRLFVKEYNENINLKKDIIVLEFDTFEIMESNLKRKAWVLNTELFKNLSQTLFIIAGRNKPEYDSEGTDINTNELLGFTNEEVYMYIDTIDPNISETLKQHIFENSHTKVKEYGNPLYLSICKKIYLDLIAKGVEPCKEDFSPVFSELVDRLLSYKSKEEKDILTILATLESWNNDFAYNIMDRLRIPSFLISYDEVLKSEFINKMDSEIDNLRPIEERYNMDKTLTSTISQKTGSFFKFKIAEMATDYYLEIAKNSFKQTAEYIKWKIKTLDRSEIIPFLEKEFYNYEEGPLKNIDEGIKKSNFIKKFILDIFIKEIEDPAIRYNLLNRRGSMFENETIGDYLSAIEDYNDMFEIAKSEDFDVLSQVNEIESKDKENLLCSIKQAIAKIYKKINEFDKAFEIYSEGIELINIDNPDRVLETRYFHVFAKELDRAISDRQENSDGSEDDSNSYYFMALRKEKEIIGNYWKFKENKISEISGIDIDRLMRVAEIYSELGDMDQSINQIENTIEIINRIKGENSKDNPKVYLLENLFEVYSVLADNLYLGNRKEDAIELWEKIIKDGLSIISKGLTYIQTNIYKMGNEEKREYKEVPLDISEYVTSAALSLYMHKDDYRVFDVYKKAFSNEYIDTALFTYPISKMNTSYIFSTKIECLENLVKGIKEKEESQKYINEINDICQILINDRFAEDDKYKSKLEYKVKVLGVQRDYYDNADELSKAIELSKEIIKINEEVEAGQYSTTNEMEKLMNLLEKSGNIEELLEQKIKLEDLRLQEGLKKFDYYQYSNVYDYFKSNDRIDLYIKIYDDFYTKIKESHDSEPIQILYAMKCKIDALNKLEETDNNIDLNEIFSIYNKNYGGTIEEKFKQINKEKAELGIGTDDIIKVLENICKIILDIYEGKVESYDDNIIQMLIDYPTYALISRSVEYDSKRLGNLVWSTSKPKFEISSLYSFAYNDKENKEKILENWEKRKKEIANHYGEKSYESYLVNLNSLIAKYDEESNDENLSYYVDFLKDAEDYIDKYILLKAKNDLLRFNESDLDDEKFIEFYDEVYENKLKTKGSKSDDALDLLNKYVKGLTKRGLSTKVVELLKNVDEFGETKIGVELKQLKLENLLALHRETGDQEYIEKANKILNEFDDGNHKVQCYKSKFIYGNYLFSIDKEKGFLYLKEVVDELSKSYDINDKIYEEIKFEYFLNGLSYDTGYIKMCNQLGKLDEAEKYELLYLDKFEDFGMFVTYEYVKTLKLSGQNKKLIEYVENIFSNSYKSLYRIDLYDKIYTLYKEASSSIGHEYIANTEKYIKNIEGELELSSKEKGKSSMTANSALLGIYHKGLGEYEVARDYLEKSKEYLTDLYKFGHSITGIRKTFIDKIIDDMKDNK